MPADAETMALCAIRYTIGRQSYIVSDGQAWAIEWGAKSPHVRGVLIRDLREAVQRCDDGLPSLGCIFTDEPEWRRVLTELERMEAKDE